jgi:hypothetical protein
MKIVQYRPKGEDGPPYAPGRDLAYVFPAVMREAVSGLDKVNWPEYFKDWATALNLSDADLAKGVTAICDAVTLFTGDPSIKSPEDALERSGVTSLPHPVRVLLFERIGEAVLGGFFFCIRDVTVQGTPPPQLDDIAKLVATGRAVIRRLRGETLVVDPIKADEVDTRLMYLERSLQRQIMFVAEAKQETAQAVLKERATARQLDELRSFLTTGPWYVRLYRCVQVFWRKTV